jgi:hypothetical protein
MNKNECRELLTAIAAVDNRKVSQETLDIWFDILRNIPLDIALEAHKMARKSESVGYLEPKHIVSFAREAAFALDRNKPKAKEETLQGDPMPKCRDHHKAILTCDPCCHRLYKYSQAQGYERIHAFAKAEIYG